MKALISILLSILVSYSTVAQESPAATLQKGAADSSSLSQSHPQSAGTPAAGYRLGPGDQISLTVAGLEDEYNQRTFRIDSDGDVTLPNVGTIHVAGLTSVELQNELQLRLENILKTPHVIVTVVTFGSQPVSVLGAVKNPGIVQLQGRKTLFDVLSMAGGLQPDAGYVVQITRPLANGPIPLPTNATDVKQEVSVASVRLRDIINTVQARENIQILPGDAIAIPRAGVVYVIGAVAKPGGFPLNENESFSALQVLSLGEGLQSTSAPSKARILRAIPGSNARTDVRINLSHVLSGEASDVELHANDILFIPTSRAKKTGIRTVDAIVNAATYASVYARY